jgi:hypothetical protein
MEPTAGADNKVAVLVDSCQRKEVVCMFVFGCGVFGGLGLACMSMDEVAAGADNTAAAPVNTCKGQGWCVCLCVVMVAVAVLRWHSMT